MWGVGFAGRLNLDVKLNVSPPTAAAPGWVTKKQGAAQLRAAHFRTQIIGTLITFCWGVLPVF